MDGMTINHIVSIDHSSDGATPGDLLHFGAWPKSPVAPRLAQTLNALERAPPAARSWDGVTV